MTTSATSGIPDLIRPPEPNRALPGWAVSLVLHGLCFLLLVIGTHRQGTPEGAGESFHDVGLFDKANLPSTEAASPAAQTGGGAATAEVDSPLELDVPIGEPTELPLQLPDVSTIGAGPSAPSPLSPSGIAGAQHSAVKSRIKGGGGGGLGPRFGRTDGTSFFQVAAQGDRFYYVVDSSGSMDDHNAMGLARAELMASIERLDPGKQFQLLFYNTELFPMLNGKQDTFFATDINRTFARQFIHQQQPDSGTAHQPALLTALRTAPDVIFFLTDGDEPELSPRDLRDLRAANRRATQIHVIQFGHGPKLGPINWLERLASDHQGTYRYRDITAFTKE